MVDVVYSRDDLLSEISKLTVMEKYCVEGEKSPQDAFARAAKAYADDDAHAQRLYDYASKLWFGFSSPILSNGGTKKGLGISCFLNYIPDSLEGLASNLVENIFLSTGGGGIGTCFNAIRSNGAQISNGGESTGLVPHLHLIDAQMLAYQQGKSRRGKVSFNLDISHPEIEEFIDVTNKKGGDIHRRAVHSFNCVSITDAFMAALSVDGDWNLVDPHTGSITKTIRAWDLWGKILTSRCQEGVPYIHFVDTTNRHLPLAQQLKGLKVHQTNLCSEITLPTNEERTAVCCLSSVNIDKYDEWRDDPRFIEDLVRMLDNVLTHFIANAPDAVSKAKHSALMERSIGIGAMGWHSFLQSKMVPFESAMAISYTNNIFNAIKTRAEDATRVLANERGAAPDSVLASVPVRNMHLLAIAPNATSSIICGNVSPSIEPRYSNYFTQKTQNGMFVCKNEYLEQYLETIDKNTEEVWQQIKDDQGSVQGLEFMPRNVKKVFKTAFEIDQAWIIEQASHRQKFICQSQSLNLFIHPDEDRSYVHAIHYMAWLKGLKTLYYVRSKSVKKVAALNEATERVVRPEMEVEVGEVGYKSEHEPVESDCLFCEG